MVLQHADSAINTGTFWKRCSMLLLVVVVLQQILLLDVSSPGKSSSTADRVVSSMTVKSGRDLIGPSRALLGSSGIEELHVNGNDTGISDGVQDNEEKDGKGDVVEEKGKDTGELRSSKEDEKSEADIVDEEEFEGGQEHEALFFLVQALLTGCAVSYISSFRMFSWLQESVTLFLLGLVFSTILDGFHIMAQLGAIGRSYEMWMHIDPHVLIFSLLPPLLAGDAMTIDTHVSKSVCLQCLYLAGPGVLVSGSLTAIFLYYFLPHGWSWTLCFTLGSILCATDPVAVVALLKELGASPVLTVQIQGESLLNDGTAIVMFMVSYNVLRGIPLDTGDVLLFLVKTCLYAATLGITIGGFFFVWIRLSHDKLNHKSAMLQVALTIVCAYTAFCVAEGAFEVSGVLTTVASSLVLAHKMWPEVANTGTMHTVWEMLEYIGNTIIFFVAGALTGNILIEMNSVEYLYLIGIYIALMIIRSIMIIGSRPILRQLRRGKHPVTMADALVMSWGGLRGAVGMALAIQVSIERANGKISKENGDRVLFYVGGVAMMTLMINATSCPALVRKLGITHVPKAKRQLMLTLHKNLSGMASEHTHGGRHLPSLDVMLDDVKHYISAGASRATTLEKDACDRARAQHDADGQGLNFLRHVCQVMPPEQIAEDRRAARAEFEDVSHQLKERLLNTFGTSPLLIQDDAEALLEMVLPEYPDPNLQRAINEAFMALVKSQYWNKMKQGVIATEVANTLISAIVNSLGQPCYDLSDFDHLERVAAQDVEAKATAEGKGIVNSKGFMYFIGGTILLSTCLVIFDEYLNMYEGWDVALETIFNLIFLAEFLLKFSAMKCAYFHDGWNIFDFTLLLVGLIGLSLTLYEGEDEYKPSKQTELTKACRIFRTLRMMRAIRFVNFVQFFQMIGTKCSHKTVFPQTAAAMYRFQLMSFFVRCHSAAQEDLQEYFGSNCQVDSIEVARCILQSQTFILKALRIAALELRGLHSGLFEEMDECHASMDAAVKFEKFVETTVQKGVLSPGEAATMIHPMHKHVQRFFETSEDLRLGRASPTKPTLLSLVSNHSLGGEAELTNMSCE